MRPELLNIILILLAFVFTSCSSRSIFERINSPVADGRYDSEFPYTNASKQLEEISDCIRLINSIAFYTSYVFDSSSFITVEELKKIDIERKAVQKVYFNRTASGTATLIYKGQDKILFLTVAHVVSFEDTLISYFINQDGSTSNFVQSISIKTRQTNYIPDLPSGSELEIVLIDKNIDVALLGKKILQTELLNVSVFNYPWGKSSELEWGNFVYVFSYPMNLKMVTKALVSISSKEKNTFLIDAVFNRGSSGGIVLAIRDGAPNFELVGLVKSVPADFQYTVHPLTKDRNLDFNPMMPYKGELYVEREQILRTGITKVICIEAIKDLIEIHKSYLASKGYFLPKF
ncbi:MAG: serine protease [Melioribacter sp.]|uniref:S1 family peptidase n=1 Tax=Rosettibacter primus TaxID=3111523 RepID=UPI00247ED39E|nr:serine protease [Melioribacter sp.]